MNIIHYFFLSLLFFAAAAGPASAQTQTEISFASDANCMPEAPVDSQLRGSDFIWNYTIELMLQTFERIYNDPSKRLKARAYWSTQKNSLVLPNIKERGGEVVVSEHFVNSLKMHIESAFENKYIDAVFFPDMGHSHYLIPQKLWDDKYDKYPVSEFSRMYEDLFNEPALKVLYHTAEQIQTLDSDKKLIDDPKIQWRFKTRNIVGLNNGSNQLLVLQNPKSSVNTVNELAEHFWYGGGYNVSSNINGCLRYKRGEKTFRFDMSLFDLE